MTMLLLLTPIFFAQSYALIPHAHNEDTWKEAATFLKYGMNPSAKPCEEFFEHVCGNFPRDNDTEYPNENGLLWLHQQNIVDKNLRAAIEKVDFTRPETPAYKKSVKMFFDQCISVKNNSRWQQDLYNAIASRIGPLGTSSGNNSKNNETNADEAWRLAGTVIQEFGRPVFALWQVIVSVDIEIGAPFVREVNYTTDFIIGCNYSKKLFRSSDQLKLTQLLGLYDTENLISDISSLCSDLSNATDYFSKENNQRLISGDQFRTVAPSFNLKTFLEGQIPNEYHHLINASGCFAKAENLVALNRVGLIFQKYNFETIHALTFLTILGKMQHWGEATKKGCIEYSKQDFGPALAGLYFDHIGKNISQWRDEIRLLQRNLRAAFTFVLSSADWLDVEDKEKIQKKLDTVKFHPALPDWIENETEILSRIPHYNLGLNAFENDFTGKKTLSKGLFKRMFADQDIFERIDFLFVVGAFYHEIYRIIVNNIGLSLPPSFNIDYPIAVKYGLLGYAIAHEIMHAFDATKIQFVRNASKRIKPSAMKEYEKQHQCLSTQFSSYCNQHQDLCVSGRFTLNENIADSAGIKIAYTAYKVLSQIMPVDPPMIGMLNYTNDQIFFMSMAKFWCKQDKTIDKSDPHAPNRARVELALRNVPLFARAFNCELGSKYAPLTPCRVWADIANPARL